VIVLSKSPGAPWNTADMFEPVLPAVETLLVPPPQAVNNVEAITAANFPIKTWLNKRMFSSLNCYRFRDRFVLKNGSPSFDDLPKCSHAQGDIEKFDLINGQ
jgi:hypothetical protein